MLKNSAATPARTSAGAETLRLVRKIHLYFGVFIAPALLFFAFTGAVQTLSLHEAAGTSYTPPAWLARMGQLHKDQNIVPRKPRGPRPEGPSVENRPQFSAQPNATPGPPPETLASKERERLPEKIFFLLVALGLFVSTLTGLYMAYKYDRRPFIVTGLLLAGVILPLILLRF